MAEDLNKKILIEVEAETDQFKKNITDLNQTLDGLLQRQKQLSDSGQQSTKAFQDMATQVKIVQAAIDNHSRALDSNAKVQKSSNNTLQQNQDLMAALLKQYDSLSKSEGDHSNNVKALNTQIGTLSNTITNQVAAVSKSREVFDVHKATLNALGSSFDKLKGVSGTFGPSLQDAAKGFESLKSGLSVVRTGFTSVGAAIKTTGFGLLVLVLQSVVDYFTKTAKGGKVLKGIISGVGKVVEMVNKVFGSLRESIIDAVTHPIDSLKALGNMIKENIINRFKAFSVILDGIIHLDFKKVGDGVIQAFSGVTNATDKIVGLVKTVKNGITEVSTAVVKAYTDGFKKADQAIDTHSNKLKNHRRAARGLSDKQEVQPNSTEPAPKNPETSSAQSSESEEKDKLAIDEAKEEAQKKAKELNDQLLQEDARNVTDTANPAEKLAAEKKQITDRYAFEIEQAKSANKDITGIVTQRDWEIKQLDKQSEKEKTAAAKKAEEERKNFAIQTAQQVSAAAFSIISNSLKQQSDAKIASLEKDKAGELSNSSLTSAQKLAIENKYKKQEATIKVKAFKDEQKASIAQALINGAIAITKAEAQTGVLGVLVIPGIIAETAIQVAKIASQKPPAYAKGGLHYSSDGRGGVLPGYSRTDNTNAYLRSGEGVVVSEAMQVPWARNLVSAINVGFGGRDFSMTNPGRGYAVGGIFTDGGDANRYYNQPVTDQKNLANTIAYQMINNFPPVYVDVKDVNNQQNILAQTINRVNL
jgi:hypothetical protein